jgi:hypothetical protein
LTAMNLTLSQIACALGSLLVAGNLVCILAPGFVRRMLQLFPRSRLPAWALMAFNLSWVSWVILHASLGRFEFLKPAVYIVAPLSFVAMAVFMDELLAPRMFGALLLLLANPILNTARWHPSNWRMVMAVVAYIWVVAGIVFVLSPYRFRQFGAFVTRTDLRCRVGGLVRLLVGVSFIFLGLRVY